MDDEDRLVVLAEDRESNGLGMWIVENTVLVLVNILKQGRELGSPRFEEPEGAIEVLLALWRGLAQGALVVEVSGSRADDDGVEALEGEIIRFFATLRRRVVNPFVIKCLEFIVRKC